MKRMRKKKSDFYDIINDIYKHDEFMKLNDCRHHGITRYDHCLRVSYYTYLITKALHLNYKEATNPNKDKDELYKKEFQKLFKERIYDKIVNNSADGDPLLKFFLENSLLIDNLFENRI